MTAGYDQVLVDLAEILEASRALTARSVNAVMTATYWMVGQRVVEVESSGAERAEYGAAVVDRLSRDLTARFGRGFGRRNLFQMKAFYLGYKIVQTESALSPVAVGSGGIVQTASAQSHQTKLLALSAHFALPWSAYVRLLTVEDAQARSFYEEQALRGGWSVRQLDRQIGSQYYQRVLLSKNKAALLARGALVSPGDAISATEAIRDPFVLEFLDLRDEYSEADLETAIIANLEAFLMELGPDFTFVGRQRRLRIGDDWYRIDLLFFHRRLRCLVIIDLKMGKFSHADVGQMHVYCNYAREHWTLPDENPPVGLILCAERNEALARYALEGLQNQVLAAEYRTTLPDEALLAAEIEKTKASFARRLISGSAPPHDPQA